MDAAFAWLRTADPATDAMVVLAPDLLAVVPDLAHAAAPVLAPDRAVPPAVAPSLEASQSLRMDPSRWKNPALVRQNGTPSPSRGRQSGTSPTHDHVPDPCVVRTAAPNPRTTNLALVRHDRSPVRVPVHAIDPTPRTNGTSPARRHHRTMTTRPTGTTIAMKIRWCHMG